MTNEQAVEQYRKRVEYAVAKLDKGMISTSELTKWMATASETDLRTMVEALHISFRQLANSVTQV